MRCFVGWATVQYVNYLSTVLNLCRLVGMEPHFCKRKEKPKRRGKGDSDKRYGGE